jgi:hypothetical protein
MDELTGHVRSFVEIYSDTAAGAFAEAEAHRSHLEMELWCGSDKIQHWPADLSKVCTPP